MADMNENELNALRRRNAAMAAVASLVEAHGIKLSLGGLLTRVQSTQWLYGFYVDLNGVSKKVEEALVADIADVLNQNAVIKTHRKTADVARHLSISL
jgi:hypothetical protein